MTPTIIEQVREAKRHIGRFSNLHPEEHTAMTFSGLLKCLWRLNGAREVLGYKCAEILAATLDEALSLLDQLPPPMTEAEREKLVEEMETEYQRVLGEKFGYTPKRSGSWFREAMSASLAVIERNPTINIRRIP